MARIWLLLIASIVVIAGCSDAPQTGDSLATGRVTAATGVAELESFVIQEVGGSSRLFVPGATFDRSLEDLREFVVTGSIVEVSYEVRADGPDVAIKLVRAR